MDIKELLDKALYEDVSISIDCSAISRSILISAENLEPRRKYRKLSMDVQWKDLNKLDIVINDILNQMLEEAEL